ncbi:MAG: hypothetical protein ACLS36_07225 [Streptococcus sp.]
MILLGNTMPVRFFKPFAQFFWLIVMVGLSQLIWKRVQSFITIQGG